MHCSVCGVLMESVDVDQTVKRKDTCGKEHVLMAFCSFHSSLLLQTPMIIE
jgi:hypothetical protein